MNALKKISLEILAQSTADETIFNNFSKKIKDNIKKVGVSTFVFSVLALSSGVSQAFDLGSVINLVGNQNNYAQYQYKLSDVPQQCNDFSSYMLNANLASNDGNIAQSAINQSKRLEVQRLSCADNVYRSYNVTPPKYRQNAELGSSAILYEIVNYNGGKNTLITIGNSPSVNSFTSIFAEKGDLEVESNPKLKKLLDERSVSLVVAHETFNKISRDFLNVAFGTDNPQYNRYNYDSNRQNSLYDLQQQMQKAYNNYSAKRADFVSVADSAVIGKYNIDNYAGMIDYISPPESANLAYKGRLPNRYTSVLPGSFKY